MSEETLFEAARSGNTKLLHELLAKNPLVLIESALLSSKETPLHVATTAGQLGFVRAIVKQNPELAREVNNDGYRPLDIAVITEHIDIVKEFLRSDPQICRLQGKDQRTALHYAAAYGRVEIIYDLLSTCSKSLTDITVYGETALHLSVKNNQFEAFSTLVDWLQRLNKENIINCRDCDGNTVLHLATTRRQFNTVEMLLSKNNAFDGILEVNARNSKGLTPMDILDIVMEDLNDIQIRKVLRKAGAVGSQEAGALQLPYSRDKFTEEKQSRLEFPTGQLKDWFKYFRFQLDRDSPSDTRNVLLVVAALIASVTFQAGVNPPAGLVKYNSQPVSNSTSSGNRTFIGPAVTSGLATASALLGTQAKAYFFFFGNTLGLTASLSIIIYLTGGFPFQRELLIAIFSMMFAYGFSVHSITDDDAAAYALVSVAFVLPFALRWLPTWVKKAWNWWREDHKQASLS